MNTNPAYTLISEHGEQFTEEEAQYASDNLE
ncbi:Ltp family lipoprotein [Lentibacillus daqui]|nr:Ltp family lipoprotein [Lentibacillus daqui]